MAAEENLSTRPDGTWSEMDGYSKLAPFYEDIHPGRAIEVDYYRNIVSNDVRTILDIGCGTGVLTYPLDAARRQRSGRGCTLGLDASPAMLGQARARPNDIIWIEGDMRRPPLWGRFDLITCGLNTVQHLLSDEDALAMFLAVTDRLAPEGIFAFDLFHPDPAYLQPLRKGAFVRSVRTEEGCFDLTEDTRYDAASRILSIVWRLPGDSGSAPFRMRQYWPEHVAALLRGAGLEIVAAHGGFASEPIGPAARRQVYRCRRAR